LAGQSFDGQANLRWRVPFHNTRVEVLGVDDRGATLALFDGSTDGPRAVGARWIAHDGTAGPLFQLLGEQSEFANELGLGLAPRIGGGFFVRAGVPWLVQIDSP